MRRVLTAAEEGKNALSALTRASPFIAARAGLLRSQTTSNVVNYRIASDASRHVYTSNFGAVTLGRDQTLQCCHNY